MATEALDILLRLVAAGFLGACIGFERRIHHKAIGIAGMVLIAIGSTTYMLLGRLPIAPVQSVTVDLRRSFELLGFARRSRGA